MNQSNRNHEINSKVRYIYKHNCIGIIVDYTEHEDFEEDGEVWCNVQWISEDGKDVDWIGLEHEDSLIPVDQLQKFMFSVVNMTDYKSGNHLKSVESNKSLEETFEMYFNKHSIVKIEKPEQLELIYSDKNCTVSVISIIGDYMITMIPIDK